MGAFRLTKNSGLNFRKFPVTNGTAFSTISGKEGKTALRGIPKFSEISNRRFSWHLIFFQEFRELLVEWFAFRKYNNFRIFRKRSEEISLLSLLSTSKFVTCGSRKYPYAHHGGNWKLRRGGGSKTRKIPEGRGWTIDLVSRCPSMQYGFKYRSSC